MVKVVVVVFMTEVDNCCTSQEATSTALVGCLSGQLGLKATAIVSKKQNTKYELITDYLILRISKGRVLHNLFSVEPKLYLARTKLLNWFIQSIL